MHRRIRIICALLMLSFVVPARGASDKALSHKLIDRAVDLMNDSNGDIFDIPPSPRRDQQGLARHLVKTLLSYARETKHRGKDDPIIIISTDPPLAVTVARMAFSDCPRGSLRQMRVICLVGTQYDRVLRPYAIAAGARLEVERVPK